MGESHNKRNYSLQATPDQEQNCKKQEYSILTELVSASASFTRSFARSFSASLAWPFTISTSFTHCFSFDGSKYLNYKENNLGTITGVWIWYIIRITIILFNAKFLPMSIQHPTKTKTQKRLTKYNHRKPFIMTDSSVGYFKNFHFTSVLYAYITL